MIDFCSLEKFIKCRKCVVWVPRPYKGIDHFSTTTKDNIYKKKLIDKFLYRTKKKNVCRNLFTRVNSFWYFNIAQLELH